MVNIVNEHVVRELKIFSRSVIRLVIYRVSLLMTMHALNYTAVPVDRIIAKQGKLL